MTLLVRDEEDILRENLEYHLSRGVDFIIATDNLSVDATPEILHHYQQLGVLEYHYQPEDTFLQADWVTQMAQRAKFVHGADWVFNNDADEFWWPESGGALKPVFESVPPEVDGLRISRTNFVALSEEARPFYQSMIYREATSFNYYGKPLPPKTCHRGNQTINVRYGSHIVWLEGNKKPNILESDQISILHFPMRSRAQMTNKIVNGAQALNRSNVDPRIAAAWRELYTQYQSSGLADYFERTMYTPGRIQEELNTGQLVVDTRLRDVLVRLLEGQR